MGRGSRAGGDAAGLADVWGALRRNQLFPMRPLTGLRAFSGRSDHFVPNTGLRRLLIDGGVVNNTPITAAIDAGATEVWVLSTGYSCALPRPPTTAFAMTMHAVALSDHRDTSRLLPDGGADRTRRGRYPPVAG